MQKTTFWSGLLLRTVHMKDAGRYTSGEYDEFDMTFSMHSHPGSDGIKGASGYSKDDYYYDMALITNRYNRFSNKEKALPSHYIYHPETKMLYNYTPWNPDIIIRQINKSSDFYRSLGF